MRKKTLDDLCCDESFLWCFSKVNLGLTFSKVAYLKSGTTFDFFKCLSQIKSHHFLEYVLSTSHLLTNTATAT